MKPIDLALAAVFAVSTAAPAMAADAATGRPAQLTQKADDPGKAKAAHPKSDKNKDNTRSNKGGAARGGARSDQVQDLNKKR